LTLKSLKVGDIHAIDHDLIYVFAYQ